MQPAGNFEQPPKIPKIASIQFADWYTVTLERIKTNIVKNVVKLPYDKSSIQDEGYDYELGRWFVFDPNNERKVT